MRIPKTVWAAALGFALLCGGPAALAKAPAKGKVPAESRKIVKPGEKRGFNPQPEPPAESHKHVKPGEKRGFNPQPEPPAESHTHVKPGEKRGFNPQPEPPANPKTRVRTQRKPAKPGGAVRDDMQKMDDAPVEKVRARGR